MNDIPPDLSYSGDHLWVRADTGAGTVRVGVTHFAQDSLGDIVSVDLPRLGDAVQAGTACGDIESTKSVSDLVSPITGTVTARNDELIDEPGLANSDPYGKGWLFEARINPAARSGELMDADAYGDLVGA